MACLGKALHKGFLRREHVLYDDVISRAAAEVAHLMRLSFLKSVGRVLGAVDL